MKYTREKVGGPLEAPFRSGERSLLRSPARRRPVRRVVFCRRPPTEGWFDLYLVWYGTPSSRTIALRGYTECEECGVGRCSCDDARRTDDDFRAAVREGRW
jgi:hypothetical protein